MRSRGSPGWGRRAMLMVPSTLSLLFLAVLIPYSTPRPVSLVQQYQDPEPAAAAAALRKASSSSFESASKAVAAAAAAGAKTIPVEDATTIPSVVHQSDESRTAAIDTSISGGADSVDEGRVLLHETQAQALTLVGERARILVAGTVDGQVHALNPETGDVRWSFSTGEPLVKSYQQSPGALEEKRWLIPTLDGSLLVYTAQGLRRPPFNTRALVEQTPFLAPGGTFYTGSKNSRIWGVDAQTGEVRQVLSGETADSLESDLKLLARSGSDGELIWIGRKDYTVRAFDVPTGQEQWNLTIGEFVSLDGFYSSSDGSKGVGGGSGGGSGGGGSGSGSNTGIGGKASRAGSRSEPMPVLVATPEGSLRLASKGTGNSKSGNARHLNPRKVGLGSRESSVWNAPLSTHVASVFQVTLEEGSARTYLPLQRLQLTQTVPDRGAASVSGANCGSAGTAAVGILESGQVYAVVLDELRQSEGEDSGGDGGSGRNGGGGGVSRGKKNRAGDGNKVTHGGRVSATQPLLPHSGGDWQRGDGDSADHGGGEGGGHGLSSALVQSFSQKGAHHGGPLRSCQPGHADFPNCLSGVHPVNHIGEQEQSRLALGMGSHGGVGVDGSTATSAGSRDTKGVRASTGYVSRLPPLSSDAEEELAAVDENRDDSTGGFAGMLAAGLGIGAGGRGTDVGGYLAPSARPPSPLEALLSWMSRMWSFVSVGLLAVTVMVVLDSRRAARFFKRVGLSGYPLYSAGSEGRSEYDPSTDGGFSGVSEGSASGVGVGGVVTVGGGAGVVGGSTKGEVRVGCLTVSDTVLGYGSHGTVVYRGLLEGRPVAVKRMLTDFHARADREISLLIESDGHPNVVRYFVREEAGEFVYLALQLCQLSLHNAMAQIHAAMARARREADEARPGTPSYPRVGLSRALALEDITTPPELRAALLQVSQGVEHLHSLRIVHRDLKPHNILLAAIERKGHGLGKRKGSSHVDAVGGEEGQGEGGSPRKLSKMGDVENFVLKISDMGLGKQLLNGQSSFGMSSYGRSPGGRDQGHASGDALARAKASNTQAASSVGGHVGSIGWQAPEVIADRVSLEGGQGPAETPSWATVGSGPGSSSSRRTQAVDVFSLGCIFHHCIVPSSHPFGQWYEREANIIQNKPSHLWELAHVPDAHDLVSLMTAREPDLRPSAGEVCKHPFFWNEEKRLSFLLEFSDRLEQDSVQSPLLVMVEAGADSVVGRSWDVRLDPELTEDAGRYRKYDFSSVRDLLRVVRNKRHHFHELPERVQRLMSPLPGGFLRYVEERFPQLLMHCTKVTGALLSEERIFKEYLVPFRRPPPPSSSSPSPSLTISAGRHSNTPAPVAQNTEAVLPPAPPPAPQANTPPATSMTEAGAPPPAIARGVSATASSPSVLDDRKTVNRPSAGSSPTLSPVSGASAAPLSPLPLPPGLPPEGNFGGARKTLVRPVENMEANGGGHGAAAEEGENVNGQNGAGAGSAGATAGTATVPGNLAGAAGVTKRVTQQNGPRGEGALMDVLLWNESAVAKSMGCRGWWRHQDHWQRRLDVTKQRPRGAHLNKALQDPKYRTRLCSHWENSKGTLCPMRRRGAGKCDFAHGGLELRVRINKRDRWGRHTGPDGGAANVDASGGEDTLGAARSIGRIRMENGTRDGVGSAAVAGGIGGGGGSGGGGGGGGAGVGGGSGNGLSRAGSKRARAGGAVQAGDGTAGNWQGPGRGGGGESRPVGMNDSGSHRRNFPSSSPSPSRGPPGDVPTEVGANRGVGLLGSNGYLGRQREVYGGLNSDAQALPPRLVADNSRSELRVPPTVVAGRNGIAGGERSRDRSRGRVVPANPATSTSPRRSATANESAGEMGNPAVSDRS